ncbi:MAG: AlpA family phage regulatory protein [Paracoccaceae bacterium]
MTKNQKYPGGSNSEQMGRLLISAAQGAELTGVSESTWWDWQRAFPDFPKPIRISARCTRWVKSEISAWLETRRVSG